MKARSSLAVASGAAASVGVSLTILTSHLLFALAQFAWQRMDCDGSDTNPCPQNMPPGGLLRGVLEADLAYDARAAVSAALGLLEDASCGTSCPANNASAVWHPDDSVCELLSCNTCVDVLGVEGRQECTGKIGFTLMELSYWYSISHLWSWEVPCRGGATGCTWPPGRLASVLLVVFSFVWPHVKLVLLHLAYYAPVRPSRRRNLSYWLAFGGKWTLCDVIVMCVLMALVNLRADLQLLALWHELEPGFLTGCAALCVNATGGGDCAAACAALDSAIDKAVLNPADVPAASVDARLELRGEPAMYLFCVAVLLSISASVVVEHLDDRQRRARDAQAANINTALLDAPTEGRRRLCAGDDRRCALHVALTAAFLAVTVAAINTPLFSRRVVGTLPAALAAFGYSFDAEYTLLDCGTLAAADGGLNYLMSATFCVFMVACPILRPLTLLALLLVPMTRAAADTLHRLSRYLSYFYAFDVLLLAVPIIAFAAPVTSVLLKPSSFPPCIALAKAHPHDPDGCFLIDTYPARGYFLAVAAVVLWLVCGVDGGPTHKYIHAKLEPADAPPPTCDCRP